eukprot:scaffold137463_cov14-Tisochrysis_lutea.AAC.1
MVSRTSSKHPSLNPPAALCANIGSRMVVLMTTMNEEGKKHKDCVAAWQQGQKDRAAWLQRLDKGAKYTAQRRAGQAADLLSMKTNKSVDRLTHLGNF